MLQWSPFVGERASASGAFQKYQRPQSKKTLIACGLKKMPQ